MYWGDISQREVAWSKRNITQFYKRLEALEIVVRETLEN